MMILDLRETLHEFASIARISSVAQAGSNERVIELQIGSRMILKWETVEYIPILTIIK